MAEHQLEARRQPSASTSSPVAHSVHEFPLHMHSGLWTTRQLVQLQRVVGNAAVQQLLESSTVIQRSEDESFGLTTGGVTPLQQPSSLACWATVSTMMASYNDGQAYTIADIPTVVGRAGPQYRQIYTANTGLSGSDKDAFLAAMGLTAEPPASYLARAVYNMMEAYGPLWVTTDGGSLDTVHARVLIGMGGDGTPTGTTMQIIDPADGAIHDETYAVFARRYSNVGIGDAAAGVPFRAQIVHW